MRTMEALNCLDLLFTIEAILTFDAPVHDFGGPTPPGCSSAREVRRSFMHRDSARHGPPPGHDHDGDASYGEFAESEQRTDDPVMDVTPVASDGRAPPRRHRRRARRARDAPAYEEPAGRPLPLVEEHPDQLPIDDNPATRQATFCSFNGLTIVPFRLQQRVLTTNVLDKDGFDPKEKAKGSRKTDLGRTNLEEPWSLSNQMVFTLMDKPMAMRTRKTIITEDAEGQGGDDADEQQDDQQEDDDTPQSGGEEDDELTQQITARS
eukprot:s469_g3.t1